MTRRCEPTERPLASGAPLGVLAVAVVQGVRAQVVGGERGL